MNVNKFFEIAKAKGLSESQIAISKSKSTSVKLYHHEIEGYTVSTTKSIVAYGVYNGRLSSAYSEKMDTKSLEKMVDDIIVGATLNEKEETYSIFPGSEKYKKGNVYNPKLKDTPIKEKIELIKEVENDIYAASKDIVDVPTVEYEEGEAETLFANSYGLRLRQKTNDCVIVAEALARRDEETKNSYEVFLNNDLSKFKKDEFVKKLVKNTLDKFGADSCKSGKYPTVLSTGVGSSLIGYFLSSVSAEEVQKKSSLLIDKLGEKVASKKLTIEEKPLARNMFFTYFDDEGVATKNKVVIKNGVLQTYFHNRETAKKAGVESTGNGTLGGGKCGVGFNNIFVKPGKKSFDEMIAPIKEGVYITEVAGLGTGMNAQSGNFSCQAEGFMIRDGKLAEPLNLITLSGNLLKMLNDIKDIDKEAETRLSGTTIPHLYISKMSIGGK